MNVLRSRSRLLRPKQVHYSTIQTPFVPPASLPPPGPGSYTRNRDRDDRPRRPAPPPPPKPTSPSFYTGRPSFYDQVASLEQALHVSRHSLRILHLYPLPLFALKSLPPFPTLWKPKSVMAMLLVDGAKLTTIRYRRVVSLLNQIHECRRIARASGCESLDEGMGEVLKMFERDNLAEALARGKRKPVGFDELGRSYTIGRRKESSARVWMVPVRQPQPQSQVNPQSTTPAASELANPTSTSDPISTSTILINTQPLPLYFTHARDRETILRPLRLAGLLGAYNVFALVRGGGTTGQVGAVTLGIARGLVAWEQRREREARQSLGTGTEDMEMKREALREQGYEEEEIAEILSEKVKDKDKTGGGAAVVRTILSRAKLLRRDPRMVERKKTGLAKARKRYSWVKR